MKQLVMDAIVRETGAIKVQSMGHVLTIYRQAKEPKNPVATQVTGKSIRSFLHFPSSQVACQNSCQALNLR